MSKFSEMSKKYEPMRRETKMARYLAQFVDDEHAQKALNLSLWQLKDFARQYRHLSDCKGSLRPLQVALNTIIGVSEHLGYQSLSEDENERFEEEHYDELASLVPDMQGFAWVSQYSHVITRLADDAMTELNEDSRRLKYIVLANVVVGFNSLVESEVLSRGTDS